MKKRLNLCTITISFVMTVLLTSCSPVNIKDENDIKRFLTKNTFKTNLNQGTLAFLTFTEDNMEKIIYMDGKQISDNYFSYRIGGMVAGRRVLLVNDGEEGEWNLATTGFINSWKQGKLFSYMQIFELEKK